MQTTTPLTKQEQTYLNKLIDNLNKKSKLSDNQSLILALSKKQSLSSNDTHKLKLLLKAEKIREDDLEIKRQLKATLKAEKEQVQQQEQAKENLIGKKIIQAIRENILLGKDYPYTKLLRKMVEQGLFSDKEQELLAEFLVQAEINSEESSKHIYGDIDGENIAADKNSQVKNLQDTTLQDDTHNTRQANVSNDMNDVSDKNSDDSINLVNKYTQ